MTLRDPISAPERLDEGEGQQTREIMPAAESNAVPTLHNQDADGTVRWFSRLIALLFPYRTHLEAELEYLKQQLAQRQRRVDELQERLLEMLKPAPKVVFEKKADGKLIPVKPRGWEEVRAYRRANPEEEEAHAVQGK